MTYGPFAWSVSMSEKENNEDLQLWQAVTLGAAPATLTF